MGAGLKTAFPRRGGSPKLGDLAGRRLAMTILRPIMLAGLATLMLAGCGKKADDAAPGAVPPKVAVPGPVAAEDLPTPAPGLWEMKMSSAGGQAPATVSRICYDAATAKQMGVMGRQAASEADCTQSFTRQVDGGLAISSTCAGPDGKPMTSKGVVRGDFSKAYTMQFTQDAQSGGGMSIEAVRVGDCPADFKPGDMEVNGMRMNLTARPSAAG
jgi:hypothetical protein